MYYYYFKAVKTTESIWYSLHTSNAILGRSRKPFGVCLTFLLNVRQNFRHHFPIRTVLQALRQIQECSAILL